MKPRRVILLSAVSVFLACPRAEAAVIFDNVFADGLSGAWSNDYGDWKVTGGNYWATSPTNIPATYTVVSTLPSLTDFTVTVGVNRVNDGGLWLRSSYNGGLVSGVLLVTGGMGAGGGNTPQDLLYWHTASNGVYSGAQQITTVPGLAGSSPTISVTVSGDTYTAYVDGNAYSTLVYAGLASGSVGLYAYGTTESFRSFSVSTVPLPGTLLLFGSALAGLAGLARRSAA